MTDAVHTPFEREERFIVIKRSHLGGNDRNLAREAEKNLRNYLDNNGIQTVECVVVESDWPEYETVWQMIEARYTGKFTRTADIEAGVIAELVEAAREMIEGFDPEREWTADDVAYRLFGSKAERLFNALAKIGGAS